jgi:hypothetical protein
MFWKHTCLNRTNRLWRCSCAHDLLPRTVCGIVGFSTWFGQSCAKSWPIAHPFIMTFGLSLFSCVWLSYLVVIGEKSNTALRAILSTKKALRAMKQLGFALWFSIDYLRHSACRLMHVPSRSGCFVFFSRLRHVVRMLMRFHLYISCA